MVRHFPVLHFQVVHFQSPLCVHTTNEMTVTYFGTGMVYVGL